jgi:hypothetical protein
MRVIFIGGMNFVGPATVPVLIEAGHEVAAAHSGEHEDPALAEPEHLHGSRRDLLGDGGPVEQWKPDAIVDTCGRRNAREGRSVDRMRAPRSRRPHRCRQLDGCLPILR